MYKRPSLAQAAAAARAQNVAISPSAPLDGLKGLARLAELEQARSGIASARVSISSLVSFGKSEPEQQTISTCTFTGNSTSNDTSNSTSNTTIIDTTNSGTNITRQKTVPDGKNTEIEPNHDRSRKLPWNALKQMPNTQSVKDQAVVKFLESCRDEFNSSPSSRTTIPKRIETSRTSVSSALTEPTEPTEPIGPSRPSVQYLQSVPSMQYSQTVPSILYVQSSRIAGSTQKVQSLSSLPVQVSSPQNNVYICSMNDYQDSQYEIDQQKALQSAQIVLETLQKRQEYLYKEYLNARRKLDADQRNVVHNFTLSQELLFKTREEKTRIEREKRSRRQSLSRKEPHTKVTDSMTESVTNKRVFQRALDFERQWLAILAKSDQEFKELEASFKRLKRYRGLQKQVVPSHKTSPKVIHKSSWSSLSPQSEKPSGSDNDTIIITPSSQSRAKLAAYDEGSVSESADESFSSTRKRRKVMSAISSDARISSSSRVNLHVSSPSAHLQQQRKLTSSKDKPSKCISGKRTSYKVSQSSNTSINSTPKKGTPSKHLNQRISIRLAAQKTNVNRRRSGKGHSRRKHSRRSHSRSSKSERRQNEKQQKEQTKKQYQQQQKGNVESKCQNKDSSLRLTIPPPSSSSEQTSKTKPEPDCHCHRYEPVLRITRSLAKSQSHSHATSSLDQSSDADNHKLRKTLQAPVRKRTKSAEPSVLSANSVLKKNVNGETALHKACRNGDQELVSKLLNVKPNLDAADNAGYRPLHAACISGNVEITRELIAAGANVSAIDITGNTPLFDAASSGEIAIAQDLLYAGADPRHRNVSGEIPLDFADTDSMALLLQKSMRSISSSEPTKTEDYQCCESVHRIESTLYPVPNNYYDYLCSGNTEFVKDLLVTEDPHLVNKQFSCNGMFPLQIAAKRGHRDLVNLLISYHANLNDVDFKRNNALHHLAGRDFTDIAELLINCGCDVEARNEMNQTPLDVALLMSPEDGAEVQFWRSKLAIREEEIEKADKRGTSYVQEHLYERNKTENHSDEQTKSQVYSSEQCNSGNQDQSRKECSEKVSSKESISAQSHVQKHSEETGPSEVSVSYVEKRKTVSENRCSKKHRRISHDIEYDDGEFSIQDQNDDKSKSCPFFGTYRRLASIPNFPHMTAETLFLPDKECSSPVVKRMSPSPSPSKAELVDLLRSAVLSSPLETKISKQRTRDSAEKKSLKIPDNVNNDGESLKPSFMKGIALPYFQPLRI